MKIYTCFISSFSGYVPYSTPPAYADKMCRKLGCDHYCNLRPDGVPECTCYHGYRLQYTRDGYGLITCVDIDECSEYANGGCYHYCHNTLGSYYCTCGDEYYLSDDGLSCEKHPEPNPGLNPHVHPYPEPNRGSNPGVQPYPGPNPGSYPGVQPYPGPNPGSYPGVQPYPGPNPGSYPGANPGSYPGVQPYPGSFYQQYPPASHRRSYLGDDTRFTILLPSGVFLCYSVQGEHDRHSYLGDDPHFAVLLPSGVFLCYSVQGEHDKVFNLISNPDNPFLISEAKREEYIKYQKTTFVGQQ